MPARRGRGFDAEVLRLHGRGWTDTEIAAELHSDRHTVTRHRTRLRLPSNRWSSRVKARGNRGWFRKGQLSGIAAERLGTIGQTRIIVCRDRHGYRQRVVKIRMDGLPKARWIPFARHVWQRRHGPVPAGMFIAHRDGDTLNDDPENLLLLSRRDLPAWQRSVRPRMEANRIRRASRAAQRRWQDYRAVRAARQETLTA